MTTSDDLTTIPLKRCTKCSEEKPATLEYFHRGRNKDGFHSWCKTCCNQQSREWQSANRDKTEHYRREWVKNNPDKVKRHIENAKRNGTIARSNRMSRLRHPERNRFRHQRRRANKLMSTASFTLTQWQACLEYWHHTCAYCGAQQSFWHKLEQEHYIALTKGGTYSVDNMIPACKTCNTSKRNHDPDTWISLTFGKRKAKSIISSIKEYFVWASSK